VSSAGLPDIRGSLPGELRVASFVIRLNLEDDPVHWRGHVTHVQSEERKHVRSLRQLDAFILRHLTELGFRQIGPLERFGRWLKRSDR
jgi:hypothetical protein